MWEGRSVGEAEGDGSCGGRQKARGAGKRDGEGEGWCLEGRCGVNVEEGEVWGGKTCEGRDGVGEV